MPKIKLPSERNAEINKLQMSAMFWLYQNKSSNFQTQPKQSMRARNYMAHHIIFDAEKMSTGTEMVIVMVSVAVSWVRYLMPLRTHRFEALMHVKSVETKNTSIEVVSKYGEGVTAQISSSSFDHGSNSRGPHRQYSVVVTNATSLM
ncbi:hypothetical protein TNCV_2330071 [Trichonephila clavipes]|nr:hypothetical protein TNCV_2330071 [Trichonephila clavipes]